MAQDQPDWTAATVAWQQQHAYSHVQLDGNVVAPGYSWIDVFIAPAGSFVTLGGVEFVCPGPPGATTGYHEVQVWLYGNSESIGELIDGQSNYGDQLSYTCGYWNTATKSMLPPSTQPQAWFSGAVGMDDSSGIEFVYENHTDVDQNQYRRVSFYGIQTVYTP